MHRSSSKRASSESDYDSFRIAAVASLASLLSLLVYFQRGEILLYGDSVAHINIARRVFDSQTPGLLQLGTVWLPLPHLLTIPFLLSNWMWQSGVGGSIPSMIAYVFGVVGIFRLTRGALRTMGGTSYLARVGAWIAALVYGANPNLLYLQATAMTESLYLALFVWAVVYFAEFLQASPGDGGGSKLTLCGLCVAGAELTRYDGWFLAAAIGAIVALLALRHWQDPKFRWVSLKFLFVISVAPILWLTYNAAAYGNALEFANGPYSAKAIEQKTSTPGAPPHPGTGNVVTSASYIVKAGELNMADGNWGRIWVAIAIGGLIFVFKERRSRGVLLLLWVPVIFYALSIAYGGVPLFLPAWWPFTWYNMRYGLQLLPLFAVSAGLIAADLPVSTAAAKKYRAVACAITIAMVALSYLSVWRAQPLCFKEAWVNSRTKLALESAVARNLRNFPRDANYLMYLGEHVGAFQQAGVDLRQVVNEGNHRPWRKPADPEGLWERALANPQGYVDFVIAYEGDAVDHAVNREHLTLINEIHTTGQARARIYSTRLALNQSR
jgi:hypothetical protein